jgi:hypothetical protein
MRARLSTAAVSERLMRGADWNSDPFFVDKNVAVIASSFLESTS